MTRYKEITLGYRSLSDMNKMGDGGSLVDIKKFSKSDLSKNMDSFCALYHKVFTAAANREIIEQRYLSNPYDELLMYVAMDGEKIVANYSAVPIQVVIQDKVYKAALSLNTMTDPDYSGQGLFTKLATSLYDHLSENGYVMIMGFPNFQSNRIFNSRLGWKTVYEIPTLKLCLDSYQEEQSETKVDDGFVDWLEDSCNEVIHVDMSQEYISWRFKNNKEKRYHVLIEDKNNWLIYQFYNDEINLTEINSYDGEKERKLLKRLISIGKLNGYNSITTWCNTNSSRHSYLEKIGFRLSAPIRTFGIRCFVPSLEKDVYDYRNWCIQMGDDNTY